MNKTCIHCANFFYRNPERMTGECCKKNRTIYDPYLPGCEEWEGRKTVKTMLEEHKKALAEKIDAACKEFIDRVIAEEQEKSERASVIKQVGNAIEIYKAETGKQPGVIIANVPAWDAMKTEAEGIVSKCTVVDYATYRGIRVYKVDDRTIIPSIMLARDVKRFEIETGGE